MELCKICFQQVENGIVVPGRWQASGVVHEECLAGAVFKLAQDPQKEGLLQYLIDYEEKHASHDWSKDVSGQSADVSWEWTDVGIPATKIRPLLNAGLVSIVFSSNTSTYYSLVGRVTIREALGKMDEIPEVAAGHLEIPEDLFDCITGYEDIKDDMKFTLKEDRRVHYLLIGPPATAKSLFLMELGQIKGTYFATGSTVTAAGLTDAFFTYQPRVLALDEVDKVPMDSTAVLLSVMETGDVLEAKYRRHRGLKLDLTVFAAANRDRGIPPELKSRFSGGVLYFKPYSKEEFLSVCEAYLSRYEGIPTDVASAVAQETWSQLDRDVRTARGVARRLREHTRAEVLRTVGFLRKYSKQI